MALAAHAHAIPHAPELRRADRLRLLATMARARHVRREAGESRRRLGMPGPTGTAAPGWEGVEAAARHPLREGDLLIADSCWPAGTDAGWRVGETWSLTDPLAAGLGAALASEPGEVVVALIGPVWDIHETMTLATAVERRAPLVVLQAAPEDPGPGGFDMVVSERVSNAAVESLVLCAETACQAARAGQGPTLIVCHADDGDAIELYARRMAELGVTLGELREIVEAARR